MTVLAGLVPVFLLLVVGVVARRFGVLDDPAANGLNRLVTNVALPALFISTVGTAPLESAFSPPVILATSLASVAIAAAALLVARSWRLPANQRGVMAQASQRGNIVYFTFPIILAMYGQSGLQLAAVTSTLLIPVMNLLAVGSLELHRAPSKGKAHFLVRVVANPLVSSALLGLALAAVHWRPWAWLDNGLKILAGLAFPGALLALGAQLEVGKWRAYARQLGAVGALKLAAMPALGWWLLILLHASRRDTAIGVLLLASPTAVASHSVAADLGGDIELASACVLVTTIASVVTYAAWSLLLGTR
ncbi:MAG TPA: AEC family transporter [Thermoanaerobaculaceae bacterium]|nr:AEC family transporter [Thermoanaerobaculaceae bacterium]